MAGDVREDRPILPTEAYALGCLTKVLNDQDDVTFLFPIEPQKRYIDVQGLGFSDAIMRITIEEVQ